jgi:hypothetical protein
VNSSFYQIAADLAGVIVTRADADVASPVIKATIINHEQNDLSVKVPSMRRKDNKCCIQ